MSIEYVPGTSILHRMHPITKILFIFSMFILTQFFLDIVSILSILAFVILWWLVGQLPARRVIKYAKFFASMFIVFMIAQGFFYWRGITPMFYLGDFIGAPEQFPYTYEGFLVGVSLCLRIVTIISLLPIFTMTTATDKLLTSMTSMRLPFAVSFAFVSAMRFVPLVEKTFQEITDSQRTRALDFESLGFWKRIKAYIPITIPLVLTLVRKSDDLEVAIESRAFGAPTKRTYVEQVKAGVRDVLFLVIVYAFIGFGMYNWWISLTSSGVQGFFLPMWLTTPLFAAIDPIFQPILAIVHFVLLQLGTMVKAVTLPIASVIGSVLALSPLPPVITIALLFVSVVGVIVLYVAVTVTRSRK